MRVSLRLFTDGGLIIMSRIWVFLFAALLAAPLARTAELPRSGTDSYATTYVTAAFVTMKLGERTVTTYDSSGITRNESGGPMFNTMGTRCLGTREVVGGEALNRGSCIDSDTDGDQIFSTYEAKGAKGAKGTHVFIGGTGKYAGMSGTADYTSQSVKSPDGRGMTLVIHQSNWKLSP
jgi:hypothetical protein